MMKTNDSGDKTYIMERPPPIYLIILHPFLSSFNSMVWLQYVTEPPQQTDEKILQTHQYDAYFFALSTNIP